VVVIVRRYGQCRSRVQGGQDCPTPISTRWRPRRALHQRYVSCRIAAQPGWPADGALPDPLRPRVNPTLSENPERGLSSAGGRRSPIAEVGRLCDRHVGKGTSRHAELHPLRRGFDDTYRFLGGSFTYFPDANSSAATGLRGTDRLQGRIPDRRLLARSGRLVDRTRPSPFSCTTRSTASFSDGGDQQVPGTVRRHFRQEAPHLLRQLSAMDDAVRACWRSLPMPRTSRIADLLHQRQRGPTGNNASNNGPCGVTRRNHVGRGHPRAVLCSGNRDCRKHGLRPAGDSLDMRATALAAVPRRTPTPTSLRGRPCPALHGANKTVPHRRLYWLRHSDGDRAGNWKLVPRG